MEWRCVPARQKKSSAPPLSYLTPCTGLQATPLLDYLLFHRFRAGFGGRVRFIVSGGAPLSTGVAEFLSVALCCPVFQARPARIAIS